MPSVMRQPAAVPSFLQQSIGPALSKEVLQGFATAQGFARPAPRAASAAFRKAQTTTAALPHVIQEPAAAALCLQQLTSSVQLQEGVLGTALATALRIMFAEQPVQLTCWDKQ